MVKKSMIVVFALLMGLSLINESKAQTYATGIGLRAGVSNGLTVKHFIQSDVALEGILHTRWRGLVITGLYEVHKNIREVRGLRWFYGGGAHIGSWNSGNPPPPWADSGYRGSTIVGIDGIIGLDYKFEDAPINLSLDYKPAFNIINGGGFWGDEVALSIRFTF
ncbi:MAG: hypothetical protein R6V72_07370 [Cyclobacterium sp.]|uniref:hypothetical protein n=1 Tax=unclassified Cyclobacterium TaxID=2615055 RepID=UPI0013D20F14|nr:hypothetical protein [Cyclobacterium sp. SYSU L10401]